MMGCNCWLCVNDKYKNKYNQCFSFVHLVCTSLLVCAIQVSSSKESKLSFSNPLYKCPNSSEAWRKQTGKHWPSCPYRFKVLSTSFEPPRQHGCTFRGLFFYTNSWEEKCKHKQVPIKQNEQLNYISHKKFLIRIWHVT